MAHTKLENRKVAVDAIDESKEKNEKQELLDWKRSSVIKTSEGSQYNAEQYNAELNFFQFWGRNWRQFTSVLPGLVLLITFGFNAVFTIYELNKLNSLSEDISAPQKYYDSKNGNDINYPGRSVSTTSIYRNHDYYGTTARYDSYRGYRSSGSTHDDYGRTEGKPKLSLLGVYIVVIMWFIGAIIGNMLGASWIRKLKKRTNYYFAAILQIVAGFLFFLLRHEQNNTRLPVFGASYKSLMLNQFTLGVVARFVSGIVCGLVYLTVTVHASDISSKRMRRVISYSITMTMAFSTLYYAALMPTWIEHRPSFIGDKYSLDFHMMAGGLLVLLLIPLFTNETVPYYLTRGNVAKAQNKFTKLNNERSGLASAETMDKFDELQLMVREDMEKGWNIFGGGNLKPLFIVLSARLLHLFVVNVPMMMIIMELTLRILQYKTSDNEYLTELSAARILVGYVLVTAAACLGQHKFFYISAILIWFSMLGVFLITFVFGLHWIYAANNILMWALPAAFCCLSLGLDYYQQEQSGDAFTITKKPWSLATVAIFEHLIHVGLIIAYFSISSVTMALPGILIPVLSYLLLAIVPDTQKLSLRETTKIFNEFKGGITNTGA